MLCASAALDSLVPTPVPQIALNCTSATYLFSRTGMSHSAIIRPPNPQRYFLAITMKQFLVDKGNKKYRTAFRAIEIEDILLYIRLKWIFCKQIL